MMILKTEQKDDEDNLSDENISQQNQVQHQLPNPSKCPQLISLIIIFSLISLLISYAYFQNPSSKVVQQQQVLTNSISNNSVDLSQKDLNQSKLESEVKKIPLQHKEITERNETEVSFEVDEKQLFIREEALRKFYSVGLKANYENIQQEITVMRWVVPKKEKKQSIAYVVNGLAECQIQVCLNSIQSILNHTLLVSEVLWLVSNQTQTNNSFKEILKNYYLENSLSLEQKYQKVNVSYSFLSKNIAPSTKWIFFIKNGAIIKNTSFQVLHDSNSLAFLLSPSGFQPILATSDLSSVPASEIDGYGLCFSTEALKIITPLNFAFQNVYSLNELILLPVLALAQNAQSLEVSKKILFFQVSSSNSTSQLLFTLSKNLLNQKTHICVVSTPSVPQKNSVPQIVRYLTQVLKYAPPGQTRKVSISVIISIIYSPEVNLTEVVMYIRKLSAISIIVRIRFRLEKVFVALEVYQLYYGYCPTKSVIFASRYNVVPILTELRKAIQDSRFCRRRKWLMMGQYLNIDSNSSQDLVLPSANFTDRTTYLENFEEYFFHAQIFCMELASQMRIQIFKWQELQFYETEASFMIPAWERAREKYNITNKTIYKIVQSREMSKKERQQIQGMAYREIKSYIRASLIKPLEFCELNNFAFKRNPPELIPRIIHQIWLSDAAEMSPIKNALMKTLKSKNPQFQYRLWKLSDVTRANFPITYDGILKFEAISKQTKKNYRALIADLMRIEILYKYGGIYMDLKIEGKKSLLPFLKYEEFYLIANQYSLVNGLIGSVPGNRHLATMLRDFFDPSQLRAPKTHIYELTGGTKLIQAYTRKQLYTQVCSFQQFILEGPRPCVHGSQDFEKDIDQEQFKGISGFVKKSSYRVLIPCKVDTEKYLDLYDILGRTYFPGASKFS